MSTTINVTVDDGGLPAKNRQQTAANRQAFVQGKASQQAAQQGADQRAADRRTAGLDPTTGRPTGSSSRLPRVKEEPAANRHGGFGVAAAKIEVADHLINITPAFSTTPRTFQLGVPYPQFGSSDWFTGDTTVIVRDPLNGCSAISPNNIYKEKYLSTAGCQIDSCWAPGVAGYTDHTTREYGNLWGNGISADKYIVFPLGPSTMIVSFIRMFRSIDSYGYGKNIVTDNKKIAVQGTLQVSTADPCGGLYGYGQQTITATTDTGETDTQRSYQEAVFLSVLIDKTTVVELPTPLAVRSILQDWSAEEHTISASTLSLKTFTQANGQTVNTYGEIVGSVTPYTVTQDREFYTRTKTIFFPGINITSYRTTNLSATPSIYASVADPNTRIISTSIGNLDQVGAYAAYYESLPNTKSLTGLNYVKYEQKDGNKFEIYSGSSLGPGFALVNPQLVKSYSFSTNVNTFAWNWNDENFCRSRLIDLGFSL